MTDMDRIASSGRAFSLKASNGQRLVFSRPGPPYEGIEVLLVDDDRRDVIGGFNVSEVDLALINAWAQATR